MAKTSKRDNIIETAMTLFSVHGYHNVGVDRIKEEAGVSKMTLYRYFPTKEKLIEDVLSRRDAMIMEDLDRTISAEAGTVSKMAAIFDWHSRWFGKNDFHGCMFIKASDEFPDRRLAISRLSRLHKEHVRARVLAILEEGNVPDAQSLSRFVLLVLDGMIVNANIFNDGAEIARTGWQFVSRLIQPR